MMGGANPPSVVISPVTGRDGAPKHTLSNIVDTGEYVINVVTYDLREQMNRASVDYPEHVSEWEMAGLTPQPSVRVAPPRAAESPIAMECRLYKVVPHGVGHMAANYVIGEVVYFHVARKLMPEGVFNPGHIEYVARLGGDAYLRSTGEGVFALPRLPKP
jgi:flavin reductase (DIM6/NTAB) family NADH-FMN oxidoreductase RutF